MLSGQYMNTEHLVMLGRTRNGEPKAVKGKSDKLNSMVKEQVDMIRKSQEKLQTFVENIDAFDQEVNLSTLESVKNIVMKSEDLIVMVQIIIKVRNELGHSRLDFEKARKANKMVSESERRVHWLEHRLEDLLIQCHTQSSSLLNSTKIKVMADGDLYDTYCSTVFQEILPSTQRERLLSDVGGYLTCYEDEVKKQRHYDMALQVMDNSQKMIHKKDQLVLNEHENVDESSLDTHSTTLNLEKLPTVLQTHAELAPQKDVVDEIHNNVVTEAVGSIGKTLTTNDIHPGTREVVSRDQLLLKADKQSTRPVVMEEKRAARSRLSELSSMREDSVFCNEEVSSEDEVDKYWKSDHHKFEWPDPNVQERAPLSWHSLGISVQDSFVAKEKPSFSSNLPWREKAIQVNNVLDIHKIALDKLYVKLHHMYDAIEKATQASINPILKQDKIEPRMANIESRPSFTDPKSISVESGRVSGRDGGTEEARLPEIGRKSVCFSTASEQKPYSSRESYQNFSLLSPTPKPPELCYPRSSTIWCPTQVSAGRIVEKIITTSPAKQNRSQSIISKKLGKAQKKANEKKEPMTWRPSIVYKMIKATKVLKVFQSQVKHWNVARISDTKLKRVNWLLGPHGLQSGTRDIVISALKTLSKLRCFEYEVGEVLKKVLRQNQDPRIIYEASKTLILSGHWFPAAIEVLIHALKFGSKSLKVEILNALFSVNNVPQFYSASLLSTQLKDCLIDLVKDGDKSLAYSSALCLGKLSVDEPVAKNYLIEALQSQDYTSQEKGQALDLLVHDMHCKDENVINSLLCELSTSINWKVRVKAADLLVSLASQSEHNILQYDPEGLFNVLERLLWDHAHQDVRSKVAELINTLKLRERACSLVLKRLDDPVATVRGRAIIALTTLEMKSGNELKALLDILALDSSVYARIQAMRAFSRLKWSDPRVLRSLREREKGGGILAKEARKAMKLILEPIKPK